MLTSLRRIRSLEGHVVEIRLSQTSMQKTLQDIASHLNLRSNASRSPPPFAPFHQPSPSMKSSGSVDMSTPPANHQIENGQSSPGRFNHTSFSSQEPLTPKMNSPAPRQSRDSSTYRAPPGPQTAAQFPTADQPQTYGNYDPGYNSATNNYVSMLPPFSSIGGADSRQTGTTSATRYNPRGDSKQTANVQSAESPDLDEVGGSGLPASGLVAPLQVLRDLADVALERAKVKSSS